MPWVCKAPLCPNCKAPLTYNYEGDSYYCHCCSGEFEARDIKEEGQTPIMDSLRKLFP